LNSNNKDTKVAKLVGFVLELYNDDEYSITVINNKDLNQTLTQVANLISPSLKDYNEKIKQNVKDAVKGAVKNTN
jgi:hypothetical protein